MATSGGAIANALFFLIAALLLGLHDAFGIPLDFGSGVVLFIAGISSYTAVASRKPAVLTLMGIADVGVLGIVIWRWLHSTNT